MSTAGIHSDLNVTAYVESRRARLVEIAQELVRIPTENRPPRGGEGRAQEHIAARLRRLGWDTVLYEPQEVEGLAAHALYWPGRDYEGRPNLFASRPGTGGGRSLILSGHIDTVPAGTLPWTRDPFGAEVEGNRLYGRGSNDMKGGVACNLFVAQALDDLGIALAGDLIFETVVDEEFGGVNGTLAARLKGITADAAILSEPSSLRICPAQRGGRIAHVTLHQKAGGILGGPGPRVTDTLGYLIGQTGAFAETRRGSAPEHAFYTHYADPVPVTISKVSTGPWSFDEPIGVPEEARMELCWQALPGEPVEKIDREFQDWLSGCMSARPDLFCAPPEVHFPIRWLPGSAIDADHVLISEFSAAAQQAIGRRPRVTGIEGPCDLYVFHKFGIPAVLWGARGGNTHAADEYVEIDSLVEAAQALLAFVCRWCGVSSLRRDI